MLRKRSASQAAYKGSIPFARSSLKKYRFRAIWNFLADKYASGAFTAIDQPPAIKGYTDAATFLGEMRLGVLAVTALAFEANIAQGPGVSVLCRQATDLVAALERTIKHGVSGIISFGIAGGLSPDLAAGDWIVASSVRHRDDVVATDAAWSRKLRAMLPGSIHAELVSVDTLILDPSERSAFHHETGSAASDMESHIAAKVAGRHKIPFVACRVIANPAHRTLPPAATVGVCRDGRPDVRAVFQSVWKEPRQMSNLLHLALDARIARRALRAGRDKLGARLAFPYQSQATFDLVAPAGASIASLLA